jgi:MFS transporter, putative metabolite:H+ symporter
MFVTIAAEQFGTNLRSTVATTVPNWARGALVPMTTGFLALKSGGMSSIQAALAVGFVSIGLAAIGAWGLKETFGKDLNYLET